MAPVLTSLTSGVSPTTISLLEELMVNTVRAMSQMTTMELGDKRPELVNPQTVTSYSTGATASIASSLRAWAENHNSANATKLLTLKIILFAGADKTEFTDWNNTSKHPIDEIYGAGKTNIFNRFRILNSPESTANSSIDLYGWDHGTAHGSSEISYIFMAPSFAINATISANLSWNRTVSKILFSPSYDPPSRPFSHAQ